MKTSKKEDILAVVAAVKKYLSINEAEKLKKWEDKVEYIISKLTEAGIRNVRKFYPTGFGHSRPAIIPRVEIHPTEKMRVDEMQKKLREGDPPIYAYTFDDKLYISPQCLMDGEEKVVAERLIKILKQSS